MEERRDFVRIRPRPDLLYVGQGRASLATDPDGFFDAGADRGLFVHETRVLSRCRYTVDDRPPRPVALANTAAHAWLGYYVTHPPGVDPGPPDEGSGHLQPVSEKTLELRLSRYVGGGMHEDLDLTNFSPEPTRFVLRLDYDADFADLEETRGERRQLGRTEREWRAGADGGELRFRYAVERSYEVQGHRGVAAFRGALTIRVSGAPAPPALGAGCLCFSIELAPGESWHACLDFLPEIEGCELPPPRGCRRVSPSHDFYGERRRAFLSAAADVGSAESETLAPVVVGALRQAKADLASLRLHDLDQPGGGWTMAAGLPLYMALFGRDTLTAAWQAALLGPEMMAGTLAVLARYRGGRVDDWRDEQPGRMLHEAHTGPLARLRFNPRGRYYGSITTSGFYAAIVAELWHWTGDRELVEPFVRPALDALRWLDEHCANAAGFYQYRTRSEQGVENQGWKDSSGAIVYEDGSPVPAPIATCEEQGFVYVAKLHLSELLWWLDRKAEAKLLYDEAVELKKRFHDAFWMDGEGFFAMGLDAEGRQIRSVGSNPGHCLAAGIVDSAVAERTADRLLAEDLFTGWGIRTLSARHPAYNPYSYHRGSVWPVEHGSFAFGLLRYGFHGHLERLARAQFEAAGLFELYRLPEVFSGHARDADHPFPALYPGTNSPQAWSASAAYSLVQSLLGLYPYAPLRLLLVDPHLPAWLPELTLSNLRVGEARVTLRFRRQGDRSDYEVLDKRGPLHVVRQPSPWSLTASFGERLRDFLSSLLPG